MKRVKSSTVNSTSETGVTEPLQPTSATPATSTWQTVRIQRSINSENRLSTDQSILGLGSFRMEGSFLRTAAIVNFLEEALPLEKKEATNEIEKKDDTSELQEAISPREIKDSILQIQETKKDVDQIQESFFLRGNRSGSTPSQKRLSRHISKDLISMLDVGELDIGGDKITTSTRKGSSALGNSNAVQKIDDNGKNNGEIDPNNALLNLKAQNKHLSDQVALLTGKLHDELRLKSLFSTKFQDMQKLYYTSLGKISQLESEVKELRKIREDQQKEIEQLKADKKAIQVFTNDNKCDSGAHAESTLGDLMAAEQEEEEEEDNSLQKMENQLEDNNEETLVMEGTKEEEGGDEVILDNNDDNKETPHSNKKRNVLDFDVDILGVDNNLSPRLTGIANANNNQGSWRRYNHNLNGKHRQKTVNLDAIFSDISANKWL